MATDKPRFSITVSEELYNSINEYQHEHRIQTQTKAIVELLKIGIEHILSDSESVSETVTEHKVEPYVQFFESLTPQDQQKLLEVLQPYKELDLEDRAEVRGELRGTMNQMLKAPKYSQNKKFINAFGMCCT